MTAKEVMDLKAGQRVFWDDPDDGICSREYVINRVAITDEMVTIEDEDGDVLECHAKELALIPNSPMSVACPDKSSMRDMLNAGEALDVVVIGKPIGNGKYQLENFWEDHDYCDSATEQWIWSIGRRYSDGVIIASTAADLYQNPDYECLWLR